MAMFKNDLWLNKSQDAAFDAVFRPGEKPVHSGIYRCTGCGREVVGEMERTLPPQNHHQHPQVLGEVRWKLAVYCDGREK